MKPVPYLAFAVSLVAALLLQLVELPESVAAARPLWLPLALAFWTLNDPRVPLFTGAMICGLSQDVLLAGTLGQYSLGLVVVVFLVTRIRGLFGLLPLWQATAMLVPVWALYTLLMFWLDGLLQHNADALLRWLPVLSTCLLWPVVYVLLDTLRTLRKTPD